MEVEEFTALELPLTFKEAEFVLTPIEYKQMFSIWNALFKKI